MYGFSAVFTLFVVGIAIVIGLFYLLLLWSIKKDKKVKIHPAFYFVTLFIYIKTF